MTLSHAPGLLIAMPDLADPNFYRSVVLLCSHNDEGAFGLVINMPSTVTVQHVCEGGELDWTGDEETLALIGGPVESGHGWVLHDPENSFEDSQVIAPGLAISASQNALRAYAAAPTEDYRLCLGYAGWGAAQLDAEVASGSWLTCEVSPELIFRADPHTIWRGALALVGIDPANLVPGNAHRN